MATLTATAGCDARFRELVGQPQRNRQSTHVHRRRAKLRTHGQLRAADVFRFSECVAGQHQDRSAARAPTTRARPRHSSRPRTRRTPLPAGSAMSSAPPIRSSSPSTATSASPRTSLPPATRSRRPRRPEGNVTPGGVYPAGTVVTVSATPDATHRFFDWSGDASGAAPSIAVTMDRAKFVQANFVPKTSQSIAFDPPSYRAVSSPPFALSATATSGLPVSFTLLSGAATLTGAFVQLTGAGPVSVQANQPGDAFFPPGAAGHADLQCRDGRDPQVSRRSAHAAPRRIYLRPAAYVSEKP